MITEKQRDRVQAVFDRITEKPESHDQTMWVQSLTGQVPADFCGTTACVAGWAALLEGATIKLSSRILGDRYQYTGYTTPDGVHSDRNISGYAAGLLGLSEREEAYLFGANRSTEDVHLALKELIAYGHIETYPEEWMHAWPEYFGEREAR